MINVMGSLGSTKIRIVMSDIDIYLCMCAHINESESPSVPESVKVSAFGCFPLTKSTFTSSYKQTIPRQSEDLALQHTALKCPHLSFKARWFELRLFSQM